MEEKVAENARKQEAEQERLREERKRMLEETMESQKANLAAYEDQLKVHFYLALIALIFPEIL